MTTCMAVWKAAAGQMLACQREGGNIQDLYPVAVVENSDTPIENNARVLNGRIRGQNFRELLRNRESTKPKKYKTKYKVLFGFGHNRVSWRRGTIRCPATSRAGAPNALDRSA